MRHLGYMPGSDPGTLVLKRSSHARAALAAFPASHAARAGTRDSSKMRPSAPPKYSACSAGSAVTACSAAGSAADRSSSPARQGAAEGAALPDLMTLNHANTSLRAQHRGECTGHGGWPTIWLAGMRSAGTGGQSAYVVTRRCHEPRPRATCGQAPELNAAVQPDGSGHARSAPDGRDRQCVRSPAPAEPGWLGAHTEAAAMAGYQSRPSPSHVQAQQAHVGGGCAHMPDRQGHACQ